MRKTYLVCYDICDDRRLAKVHKTLRGFGDHLQYSIFECQWTAADLARCRHRRSFPASGIVVQALGVKTYGISMAWRRRRSTCRQN